MEFFAVVFGGIVVFHLLKWSIDSILQTRIDNEMRAVGRIAPRVDQTFPPWHTRPWWIVRHYSGFVSGSRKLDNHEFYVNVRTEAPAMEVVCYVPRRVLHIDVFLEANTRLQVKDVRFYFADGSAGEWIGRRIKYIGGRLRIRLYPPVLKPVSKMILTFEKMDQDFSYMVKIRAPRDRSEDHRIFKQALDQIGQTRYAVALETLSEYLKYSAQNPHVYFHMANMCLILKKYPEFEEYILKATVYGGWQVTTDKYCQFMADHWATDADVIMKTRDDCMQWALDHHHGLVALEYDQEYQLGLNHYYLKKVREVIEIRRPLAARIFNRIGFDFTDKQLLVFTACRIIKEGGTILDLPLERFVVGDSPQRNIYIAVEQSKTGSWILPDLDPGDLVEMTHHLLCHESFAAKDNRIPLSIVTTVHNQSLPTFRGRVRVRAPLAYPLRSSLRDPENSIDLSETVEGDYRTISLKVDRYVPIKNTNTDFEALLYNPAAAFMTDEKEWTDIAASLLVANFGSLEFDDDLPDPLQSFVAGDTTPGDALRQAFYWTRDKLKYAAVDSANRQIGQPNRAAAIVESGIADCKNKSYLLYLVGKKLGLDIQLIAVSSQHGIVFDDLPSDQFDHVFVRVRLNDRWHYLDAANRFAVFDACPTLYQGMDMLVLTDGGRPETIQIDPPENSRIVITETFDRIRQGWLAGSFHLEARGNIARLIDEHWKSQSMQAKDSLQTAQSIIQHFMPSSVLMSFDRLSHTSHTDIFEVVGMSRRCQLSTVGKHLVGTLEWNDPTIPVGVWRSLRIDQAFGFGLPAVMETHTVFAGELPARMAEYSDPFFMENQLCDISSGAEYRDGKIVVNRRVIIKEKFVKKELLELVPGVMEGIEKVFQMAIILKSDEV